MSTFGEPMEARFCHFEPPPFPRPYDVRDIRSRQRQPARDHSGARNRSDR